jgi:hypothetical protein
MSAISSVTFEPFVAAILISMGKSLMPIILRILPAHWYYYYLLAGCVGCIGRMTLSSPPPTSITSRLTTIGRTYTYVFVFTSHCEVKAGRADWVD